MTFFYVLPLIFIFSNFYCISAHVVAGLSLHYGCRLRPPPQIGKITEFHIQRSGDQIEKQFLKFRNLQHLTDQPCDVSGARFWAVLFYDGRTTATAVAEACGTAV